MAHYSPTPPSISPSPTSSQTSLPRVPPQPILPTMLPTHSTNPHLTALPDRLLTRHLFPHLDSTTLLLLAATCTRFNSVISDDTLWLARLHASHPSVPAHLLSPTTLRRVYIGLRSPRVFIWGDAAPKPQHQPVTTTSAPPTGLPPPKDWSPLRRPVDVTALFPDNSEDGVYMVKPGQAGEFLPWGSCFGASASGAGGIGSRSERGYGSGSGGSEAPGSSAVVVSELCATATRLVVQDTRGGLWGLGTSTQNAAGAQQQLQQHQAAANVARGKPARDTALRTPHPIPFHNAAATVTGGPNGFLATDEDAAVYEFDNWGHAYVHSMETLSSLAETHEEPSPRVLQLSSGGAHSAALLDSGVVLVWFPNDMGFEDAFKDLKGHLELGGETLFLSTPRREVLGQMPVCRLPPLPVDRDQRVAGGPGEEVRMIASGRDFVVALKHSGSVWVAGGLEARIPLGEVEWEPIEHLSSRFTRHIYASPYTPLIASHTWTQCLNGTWTPSHARMARLRLSPQNGSQRTAVSPFNISTTSTPLDTLPIVSIAFGKSHAALLTAAGEAYMWHNPEPSTGAGSWLKSATSGGKSSSTPMLRRMDVRDPGGRAVVFYAVSCAAGYTAALALGSKRVALPDASETTVELQLGDIEEVLVKTNREPRHALALAGAAEVVVTLKTQPQPQSQPQAKGTPLHKRIVSLGAVAVDKSLPPTPVSSAPASPAPRTVAHTHPDNDTGSMGPATLRRLQRGIRRISSRLGLVQVDVEGGSGAGAGAGAGGGGTGVSARVVSSGTVRRVSSEEKVHGGGDGEVLV